VAVPAAAPRVIQPPAAQPAVGAVGGAPPVAQQPAQPAVGGQVAPVQVVQQAPPLTEYPPLCMAYEPRCVTVAVLWRRHTVDAIATTTTRRALAAQSRAEIETALGLYADLFLSGGILLAKAQVPPLTVQGRRILRRVFRDAAWRAINATIEQHYLDAIGGSGRENTALPLTQKTPCPTLATMRAWLYAHGLQQQQQLPSLAAAWLVSQTICYECSHGIPVRDTPMPRDWDPDDVAAATTRRSSAAYVGVTAAHWAAHVRYQREFHRQQQQPLLGNSAAAASIFERASRPSDMSLELLAHIQLFVMHQAVEAMQDDFFAKIHTIPERTLRLRQLVLALGMAQVSRSPPPPPPPPPEAHALAAAANACSVFFRDDEPPPLPPQDPASGRGGGDITFYTDSMEVAQEQARLLVGRDWPPSEVDGGMAAWNQRMAVIGPDPKTGAIRVWISSGTEGAPSGTSVEDGEWVTIPD